jgi:hypothetical protein
MQGYNTTAVNALSEQIGRVLKGALANALLLTKQEDTQLRNLEQATRAAMKQVGEQFLLLLIEACRPAEPAKTVPCRCGGTATFVRQREGTVITFMGQIKVARAYYLCEDCGEGIYPLDEKLGFHAGSLSTALQEAVALVGVHLPFDLASDLFERLTQISISDNGVRQATEQIGQERLEEDQELADKAWDPQRIELPEGPAKAPSRLYGSVDETSVRTEEGWRKPKLGSWYTTDELPSDEPPEEWEPRAQEISHYGDILEIEDFNRLIHLTGLQRSADRAKGLIFVADGALWIWKWVKEHYPQAVQIVDWYHAAERIWEVAHAIYGQRSDPATAWAEQRLAELWQGQVTNVLAAFMPYANSEDKDDPVCKAITYFRNNQHRMRYPEYRAKGYQIGSGTIESGSKRVIGARLKQAGMTWAVEGARQVVKARTMFFSNKWDNFCQQRQFSRRTRKRAASQLVSAPPKKTRY